MRESQQYAASSTPPLPAVLAAREAAAAAAELIADTSSNSPAQSEADRAVLIVERQLQSYSRRLTRCETDLATARTLYQHALQAHEASLYSANAGEIEHSRVSLSSREHELHHALETRNSVSEAFSAANLRLRQLVSTPDAFVTPSRRPISIDASAQVAHVPMMKTSSR